MVTINVYFSWYAPGKQFDACQQTCQKSEVLHLPVCIACSDLDAKTESVPTNMFVQGQ
jgi:hypothetical protein